MLSVCSAMGPRLLEYLGAGGACLDIPCLGLASAGDGVIISKSWGMTVKVGLKPLHEFYVVQRPSLHQLGHLNGLQIGHGCVVQPKTTLVTALTTSIRHLVYLKRWYNQSAACLPFTSSIWQHETAISLVHIGSPRCFYTP
jgi:hypothetical protein